MFRFDAKNPKSLLLGGMVALLLGNLLQLVLRFAGDAASLVMGVMGLFYGLSMGLLVMSARLKARRRAGLEDPPCV